MTDVSGGNAGSRPSADDLDGEQDGPPPPERPALTDQRRPPVRKPVPPPWPLPTARVLWFVSFAASAAAILIAFLSHEAIAVELEETLLRVAPNYDATSIGSLVDVIYWSPIAALRLSAAATYVGTALDSSIPTGDVRLDAYTRVDVSASWQVSERFEAYLAVDNLTDQQYEEFTGFEARGIAPRGGVRFSF